MHLPDFEFISDFSGKFYSNPLLGITFSIYLFSIAGVPPFVGFFGKQGVLYAAINSGYNFLAIIGIITSVISASYYLNIVRSIHFIKPKNLQLDENSSNITSVHSYSISILTLAIIFFIIPSSFVLNSSNLLALNYHYI